MAETCFGCFYSWKTGFSVDTNYAQILESKLWLRKYSINIHVGTEKVLKGIPQIWTGTIQYSGTLQSKVTMS